MNKNDSFSILVETNQALTLLGKTDVLFVDVGSLSRYSQFHIPGALHLDSRLLTCGLKPATGLLPKKQDLEALTRILNLDQTKRIITYDDEGNGWASRLTWTLYYLGFKKIQVLNGGLHSWINENLPINSSTVNLSLGNELKLNSFDYSVIADQSYILDRLNDSDTILLDVRTPQEYSGEKRHSMRGGHIPGAINLDWTELIDAQSNLKLKEDSVILKKLYDNGINHQKEIITYCQTHHRSSHTWMALKHLNFPRVRGYAGSWSEWGNDNSLPIE